jgi:hypothetical protein
MRPLAARRSRGIPSTKALSQTAGSHYRPRGSLGSIFRTITMRTIRKSVFTATGRRCGAMLLATVLAGCAYRAPVVNGVVGPGTVVISTPGIIPPSTVPGLAGPPFDPLAEPPLPPPGAAFTLPKSGVYAGSGAWLTDPGGNCQSAISIGNWIVAGTSVTFGGFRGTIQPDGSLEMQRGPVYIIGRFEGSHFNGRIWAPQPSCTYMIAVDPVA